MKNPGAKRPGQPTPDISSEGAKIVAQRGGVGRNQGRKPVAEGQTTVTVSLRMTEGQRYKLQRLGGAKWVRQRIDKAKSPNA